MSEVVLGAIVLVLGLALTACGASDDPVTPLGEGETQRIMMELEDRSFRQFDPSMDASPRKGVILDFFGGNRVSLWAQFAADDRAIHEWEIVSRDFYIEGDADASRVTIRFNQATSEQFLPTRCQDCVETTGLSIGIKNVFDPDRISFKLNDPEGVLPLPFPVFQSWTDFREDEYFE